METEELIKIWNSQDDRGDISDFKIIVRKARKQRNGQIQTIVILFLTFISVVVYGLFYSPPKWSDFSLGLTLMALSLFVRISFEYITLYLKEKKITTLNGTEFQIFIKKYYKKRIFIHYIITPIVFILYIVGFTLLLPFFKQSFSHGFYLYIIYTGYGSLLIVSLLIVKGIIEEKRNLKLNENLDT